MILVVEDEPLVRMSLADHLEASGFEVVEAVNGDQAKDLIAKGTSIEALVTGVQMPGWTDGISLALWTRSNFPDIKIIIVSAVTDKVVETLGDEGHIISKPYAYKAIELRIRKLLAA